MTNLKIWKFQVRNIIVKDYDKAKSKHLEKLATKQLKQDETRRSLSARPMKGDFLKNF